MAQLNHEPSMEDILASIKRIIAEDSETVTPRAPRPIRREAATPSPDPFGEKLMSALAEREAEVGRIEPLQAETGQAETAQAGIGVHEQPAPDVAIAPEVDVLPASESVDVLELTSPIADDITPAEQAPSAPVSAAPATSEPPEAPSVPKEPVAVMDRLMSDPAAQASRSAFAALTQLQVRAEAGQENTLEGLVADMLRPMLREWLDRELPAMVERLVAEEIARVSGRA